jgi:hypothetical protein
MSHEDAFARVQQRLVPEGECLVYSGARTAHGYGSLRSGGRTVYAHRVAAEGHHGPPPTPKSAALHSCDNPPCCRREHLRWGNSAENHADMYERGRNRHNPRRGTDHHSARMTPEKVRECRELRDGGAVLRVLAERYGITIAAVHRIVTRKVWRNV